ncbi:hypothetical protein JZ751_008840 [Albula glossodonta]|uniref:Uncharacterized protein n=1 Tax=Albula glossodonta TaxID=121402 RepID=A0A8T2P1T0_9TELE|nr:hypothetical protein JZ751_008840 [Albula glossodonta]
MDVPLPPHSPFSDQTPDLAFSMRVAQEQAEREGGEDAKIVAALWSCFGDTEHALKLGEER